MFETLLKIGIVAIVLSIAAFLVFGVGAYILVILAVLGVLS